MMVDTNKLVERSRMLVSSCERPLFRQSGGGGGGGGDHNHPSGGGGSEERDPETYDDGEFYRTMLKEFLEANAAGVAVGSGGMMLNARTKVRKNVDRRASKGRKIRYHVMDKLVAFMTPDDHIGSKYALASNVFNNLFGQRAALA